MQSYVFLLAFSAACISYVSAGSTKLAGPYEIEFRRIEHCEDEGTKEFLYHSKLNKASKYEYAYNGEMTFPNNTVMSMQANVFKKLNGGAWAKTFDYHLDNFCEGSKETFQELFRMYTEDYLKVPVECPIPAGTYNADNWIFSIKDFPLEEMEYGVYRVEIVLERNEERIGCVLFFVDVEEKPAE